MEEVLKEPSSEDGDSTLREASLRAPNGLVVDESSTVVVNGSLKIWIVRRRLVLLVELELVGYGVL